MPASAPVRPRQKLPPPTTTATSTSRFWRRSMMSRRAVAVERRRRRAPCPIPGQRLTRRLEDDAAVQRGAMASPLDVERQRTQPISTWAKLTISAPPSTWLTDCLSSLAYGWSSSATSLKKPLRRPSTILSTAASGLPSLRVMVSASRSRPRPRRPGRRHGCRYFGRAKAMCTAMSWASSAVPPAISTSTALTPRPPWMCW